jgi:hypothetical protein
MHARAGCDIEIVKAMHSAEQFPRTAFDEFFPLATAKTPEQLGLAELPFGGN